MSAVPSEGDELAQALERATAIPAQTDQVIPEPPPFEEIPVEAYANEPRANGSAHDEERPITTADFWAYMPQHNYIYAPTRELWPAASVNSRIPPIDVGAEKPLKASQWLDQNRACEQMIWSPGSPPVIEDRLVSGGGWLERPGCRTFNLYLPPTALEGDPTNAGRWLEHTRYVYPDAAEYIIRWLAHRAQKPGEKINHALVLGGAQGVGKDTIVDGVKHAIGTWNIEEVSPTQLMGRFNGFLKSVILRVSEARDQGDAGGSRIDRYAVYEHCKTITAAPPDVLRVDEKNIREHAVVNVCGVIFTTNHKDGLYLPSDDRRHYVAWSERTKQDYAQFYWRDIYAWYEAGGYGHVAAYLRSLDLTGFDPKAPPPKTPGWHRMVDAGRAPEDAELADALDALSKPADGDQSRRERPVAVTVGMLAIYANDSFKAWITERKNSRQIPHRLEDAGYVAVRNDDVKDGLWVLDGKRQVIYCRRELALRDRLSAATDLAKRSRG